MSKLKQYRAAHKISQEAFAATVGALQSTISKIEHNLQTPSLELAVKIDRATNGAVTPEDWLVEVPPEQSDGAPTEAATQ